MLPGPEEQQPGTYQPEEVTAGLEQEEVGQRGLTYRFSISFNFAYPDRLTWRRVPSVRIATRLSLAYGSILERRSMLRIYER